MTVSLWTCPFESLRFSKDFADDVIRSVRQFIKAQLDV